MVDLPHPPWAVPPVIIDEKRLPVIVAEEAVGRFDDWGTLTWCADP